MQAHIDTEEYLQQLSQSRPEFGYTVIREGLYTESYPLYTAFFDPENPRGEIKIPHDGSGPGIAWVKREESSPKMQSGSLTRASTTRTRG
jgi:hypothetical protein